MDITLLERSKRLIDKIKVAEKILIVPDAARIDWDCMFSALAMKWWLTQLGKSEVKIYIFTTIAPDVRFHPDLEQIESKYIHDVDFNHYDLIIMVDGSEWERVFTRDYEKVHSQVSMDKFINIDHHPIDRIEVSIPENSIRIPDSCTSKVIYDYFIEPSGVKLDEIGAQYLYYGLVDDTQCFSVLMFSDTFTFAQKMVDAGADHYATVEQFNSVKEEAIRIMGKLIEYTEFLPEIESSIVVIDQDLLDQLNNIHPKWEDEDLIEFYKRSVLRQARGINYGIIFKINVRMVGQIKVHWRSRNIPNIIKIQEVVESIGFTAGGHIGAGSGRSSTLKLDEAKEKFIAAMKARLNKA